MLFDEWRLGSNPPVQNQHKYIHVMRIMQNADICRHDYQVRLQRDYQVFLCGQNMIIVMGVRRTYAVILYASCLYWVGKVTRSYSIYTDFKTEIHPIYFHWFYKCNRYCKVSRSTRTVLNTCALTQTGTKTTASVRPRLLSCNHLSWWT